LANRIALLKQEEQKVTLETVIISFRPGRKSKKLKRKLTTLLTWDKGTPKRSTKRWV